MNPFTYGKAVFGGDYCERPVQEKLLASYMRSGQNVLLQGERRIGKTSLAVKTAASIRGKRTLYADFMFCNEVRDVTERIAIATLKIANEGGFLKKGMQALSFVRPTMSFDETSGKPTFSLSMDAQKANSPSSIEQALDAISTLHQKHPIIVIFDEFQDVLRLPKPQTILARMRSRIQFHERLPYIFTGSSRVGMDSIFSDPKSPFYKSTAPLLLDPLSGTAFETFLSHKFRKTGRNPQKDLWPAIHKLKLRATGDLQQLCWALWQNTVKGDSVCAESIPQALETIYTVESSAYEMIASNSSPAQLKLLTGFSKLGGDAIYSNQFKQTTGILSNGTITKACRLLEKRHVLNRQGKGWSLANPFFGLWLAQR